MLNFDERRMRTGKSVGLPYQGSKKKISKKIIELIKQNFGNGKPIYDIFGGGGSITTECIINGFKVHYNDIDSTVTDMFQKVLTEDREYLKTLIVSREEFFKIRDKELKTVDDELKLLVNSFGNKRRDYLYSKEKSDIKYSAAVEIIKKHNTFKDYRKTTTYHSHLQRLLQLERLGQLEHLQRLGQLEHLQITNYSYEAFSDIKGGILYLDPPYEGTTISGYRINSFDSVAFYDWAFWMAKKNIVLLSSYKVSDSRFGVAYEFETARSSLQVGASSGDCEKLFMPLWQLEQYTSEQLTLF